MSKLISQLWRIAAALTLFTLGFLATASAADAFAPTFNKGVAPILFKHCANCHRPGQIGASISLLSYDTARPFAEAIKKTVLQREMPPWPADPKRSAKFRNDPTLTQHEIDTLVAWVNAGAPKGNDADLPPLPSFPEGWLHPKGLAPDLILSSSDVQLPAQGEIPYLRFLTKVPFSEDKWIVAMQVLPGNPVVVHHMAITELALADGVTPDNIDKLDLVARKLGFSNGLNTTHVAVAVPGNHASYDMLGVYTPGTTFEMYEGGSAKLLKGGRNLYLNFNIHYQTTGKPEKDQSRVAFWFQPEPPKHQLFRVPASGETIIADGRQLLTDAPGDKAEGTSVVIPPIPPGTENYEVIGVTAYTGPVTIYQFQPHAHLRGKDFKYAVVYPDGREQTLLTVPKYNFHWQLAYDLDTPLKLPPGSKLIVAAHYDNSPKNENLMHHHGHGASDPEHANSEHSSTQQNPGPEQEVHFREKNQSWDEMFTPFIQYTIDDQNPAQPTQPQSGPEGTLEHNALVVEVVGCLEQGPSSDWILNNASDPVVSKTQSTSSADLKAAAIKPLGNQADQLLGVTVFSPSSRKGQKVAVKGVLITDINNKDANKKDENQKENKKPNRINVTSLQMVAATCF
jgi:mono/diheme cytochrome c family protein